MPYEEPVHPTTGDPLTPVQRHLLRLGIVTHEVENMIAGIHRTAAAAGPDEGIADILDSKLFFGVINQATLLLTKFLEAWEDMGALHAEHPDVIVVRKVTAPLVRRITAWPELQDFRNTALAHSYLNKQGKVVLPWEQLRSGRAPTYEAEVLLLLNLVPLAALVMFSAFEAEYRVTETIIERTDDSDAPPGPGITKGEQIMPEISRLSEEVDSRLALTDIQISQRLREHYRKVLNRPKGIGRPEGR